MTRRSHHNYRGRAGVAALLGALLLSLPVQVSAASFDIDAAHSSVGFRIRHLVGRVNGAFTRFSGQIEFDAKRPTSSSVTATIDTKSIDTANEKRDAHLRNEDFFDAEKFPTMTFKSKKVTVAGKNRFRVAGDLTLRGVTRPTTLDVTYHGQDTDPWGGTRAGFTAKTVINRKDYGMSWNQTLDRGGTVLGEQVEITLEIEAVMKK